MKLFRKNSLTFDNKKVNDFIYLIMIIYTKYKKSKNKITFRKINNNEYIILIKYVKYVILIKKLITKK